MRTEPSKEVELMNERSTSSLPEQSTQADEQDKPVRKKYHSSAMYAASKWHGTVKHVKGPNAGHGLLPTQL